MFEPHVTHNLRVWHRRKLVAVSHNENAPCAKSGNYTLEICFEEGKWLGRRDSNPTYLIQSQAFYR